MSFDNIVTFIQTIGYNPLKKTPRVRKRKIVHQRKDFQIMAELIINKLKIFLQALVQL